MQTLSTIKKLGWFGLVAVGIMIVGLFTQIEDWKRDLTTNHAALDAESSDTTLRPPILDEPIDQIADRIVQWAETNSLWGVESQSRSDDQVTLHLTRTTRVFRWVDDIHVRLSKVATGVQLDAESQSRTGKADLGQNPRNLRELLSHVHPEPQ